MTPTSRVLLLPALSRMRTGRWHYVWFVFIAGLSVPVNLAARVLFSRVVSYEIAVVLSHLIGMLTAYLLTRAFVFPASGRSRRSEMLRFLLVNLVSLAITWTVSVGLLRVVFPAFGNVWQPGLMAHAIGLACASASSYFGHRHYSFGAGKARVGVARESR
jgi:putative flippase GtrA